MRKIKKKNKFKVFIISMALLVVAASSFVGGTYALISSNKIDIFLSGTINISSESLQNVITIGIKNPSQGYSLNQKDPIVIKAQGYHYVFEDPAYINGKIAMSKFSIEQGTENKPFTSTFDGKGNVFDLKDTYSYKTYSRNGIFGVVDGSISNMIIEGSVKTNNGENASVVASVVKSNGVINNITNYAEVYAGGNKKGDSYGTGIAGIVEGKVTNCVNFATITAYNGAHASGIAYKVKGALENSKNYGKIWSTNGNTSGIAEIVAGGYVKNCTNGLTSAELNDPKFKNYKSNILQCGWGYTTGIVGQAYRDANGEGGEVSNCTNYMKLEACNSTGIAAGVAYFTQSVIRNSKNFGFVNGINESAGIVCYAGDDAYNAELYNVENHGEVRADTSRFAAGIVIRLKGKIDGAYNYGNVTAAHNGKAAGIANIANGSYIANVENYGVIYSHQNLAAGIVNELNGELINAYNYGIVKTYAGVLLTQKNNALAGASAIANRIIGFIKDIINYALVKVENDYGSYHKLFGGSMIGEYRGPALNDSIRDIASQAMQVKTGSWVTFIFNGRIGEFIPF